MAARTMESSTSIRRKITLNDIAAGCGVSRATVSLVLRGSPLVNKHTRARVEEELRKQGYVYNRAAANLRRRTSSSIALVLNELGNPFFAEFAAGVDETLGQAGFEIRRKWAELQRRRAIDRHGVCPQMTEVMPPSTKMVWPVMKSDADDARKTAMPCRSASSPQRPAGVRPRSHASKAASSIRAWFSGVAK